MRDEVQTELALPSTLPEYRWFGDEACVVQCGDVMRVRIGGALVGEFGAKERGVRNLHLVVLANTGEFYCGQLARAFNVTPETLRVLRMVYEKEGARGLLDRAYMGRPRKVTPTLEREAAALFAAGKTQSQVAAEHPISSLAQAPLNRGGQQN